MNPLSIISAIMMTPSLILGIYILWLDHKKLINILFSFLMISISYWNFVSIIALSVTDKELFLFWYKSASFSLLYVPTALFIVMLIIKIRKKIMIIVLPILYGLYVFFIYNNFNLRLVYKDFVNVNGYWNFVRADATFISILYIITFLSIFLITFGILIKWYKKTIYAREKKQALVLFSSLGIFILLLFTEFVIYRFFSDRDLGLSGLYQFVWAAGIGIAIIKYRFLSISFGLYSHDVFENIDELVLVLDCNKNVVFANNNASKVISEDIVESDLRQWLSDYDSIIAGIDKLLKGKIFNYTSNIVFMKDKKTKLVIQARFSVIVDRYKDKIGVLIVGSELKGIKEFLAEYKITERELDVIRSMTTGLSNREIAVKLKITERTVKSHLINIYKKLDIKNKVELINVLKKYNIV